MRTLLAIVGFLALSAFGLPAPAAERHAFLLVDTTIGSATYVDLDSIRRSGGEAEAKVLFIILEEPGPYQSGVPVPDSAVRARSFLLATSASCDWRIFSTQGGTMFDYELRASPTTFNFKARYPFAGHSDEALLKALCMPSRATGAVVKTVGQAIRQGREAALASTKRSKDSLILPPPPLGSTPGFTQMPGARLALAAKGAGRENLWFLDWARLKRSGDQVSGWGVVVLQPADGSTKAFVALTKLNIDCGARLLTTQIATIWTDDANDKARTLPAITLPVEGLPASSALLTVACAGQPPMATFASIAEAVGEARRIWSVL